MSAAAGQEELVRRCRAGDERAFVELYRAHAPLVLRFVGRLVGPGGPADDLVQQVFVVVFQEIRRFRGDARLTTWLYGIAHRVTRKHVRAEARRRRRDGRWVEGRPESAGSAEPALLARESLAVVQEAVLALPEALRVVWVMRALEGLSTAEVAAALRIRVGTARSRLFAARREVLAALGTGSEGGSGAESESRGAAAGGMGTGGRAAGGGVGRLREAMRPQDAPAETRAHALLEDPVRTDRAVGTPEARGPQDTRDETRAHAKPEDRG